MAEIAELKNDSAELKELLHIAKRPRVKDVLRSELSSVEAKIDKIEATRAKEEKEMSTTDKPGVPNEDTQAKMLSKAVKEQKVQRTKITSFGFDQSAKNYTIYIELEGVGSLDKNQIQVEFAKKSLSLVVSNLNGKTYELVVPKLGGEIEPEKCKYRVKPDKLTVTLKKLKEVNWKALTATEAKVKEAKEKESRSVPNMDKDKDPSEGLMDLMKKMYDEGDDDMKRTIAKAWTESREKQASGMSMGL